MNNNFKNFPWPKTRPTQFFVLALLAMIVFNIIVLQEEGRRITTYKKYLPHQIIGHQFAGLEEFTKNIEFIGYYTDISFEEGREGPKLFSHAQYSLAPTILELNSVKHDYILLVCKDEKNAWRVMQQIGAKPLRRNKFGYILARKEKP